MSTHPHPRFARRAGATLCCLTVVLVGCGDDGDDDADPQNEQSTSAEADATTSVATTIASTTATTTEVTTPESTAATPETTAAAADGTADESSEAEASSEAEGSGDADTAEPAALDEPAVCDPYLAVSAAMSGEPDPAMVTPLLDEVDAAAPTDIADQVSVLTDGARTVFETGDFAVFEAPEFGAAVQTVDGWIFDNCVFTTTAELTATEYAYTGVADSYPAGRAAFRIVNAGAQAHELIVVRKNDGVDLSLEELMELPDDEAETMTTSVGGTFVASNGDEGTLVADLEPGDYVAFCMIPDGTVVAPDGSFTEGTGEPHAMLGMSFEFSVA